MMNHWPGLAAAPPGMIPALLRWSAACTLAVGCFTTTMIIRGYRCNASAAGDAAASLDVASRTVDLGELSSGETRDVVFRIVNKGQRRLVLNHLDRECGCGEPVRSTRILAPSEAVDWVVKVPTRRATGAFEQWESFATSDPTQPRLDLLVRGSVPSPGGTLRDAGAEQPREVSVVITDRQQ